MNMTGLQSGEIADDRLRSTPGSLKVRRAVPGDLAVVSYDDEVAGLGDLPLSAVAPSKHEVGVSAVELLAARVAEPDRPRRQVSILPELRVRASSGGV
ncbi:substrate-binding domain-containing protein [Streptomyces sp. NPDC054802]